MKQQIEEQFTFNLTRADNLVKVYDRITEVPPGQHGGGRRSTLQSDSLRAATVFIHATLEDLLRSIAYWKLPAANADVLNNIALTGKDTNSRKFSLGDLAPLRGKTIDTAISESVNQHLERSNYNNTDEISSFLQTIGADVAALNGQFPTLQALMLRRHQIVHRADQQSVAGQGNHRTRSISKAAVESWIAAVKAFGTALLATL